MTQVKIKRVYETPESSDGYRVLVDRLWPRGMKKKYLKYDAWEKDITPSPQLRSWFHSDIDGHWDEFVTMYRKELSHSEVINKFVEQIKQYDTVTLLYASRDPVHNHACILQQFLKEKLCE